MATPKDFNDYDIVVGEACIKATSARSWALPGGDVTASRRRAERMAESIDRFFKRSRQRG